MTVIMKCVMLHIYQEQEIKVSPDHEKITRTKNRDEVLFFYEERSSLTITSLKRKVYNHSILTTLTYESTVL